jgi:hypothetical protein
MGTEHATRHFSNELIAFAFLNASPDGAVDPPCLYSNNIIGSESCNPQNPVSSFRDRFEILF